MPTTGEKQLSHHKTIHKSNTTKNKHASLTKNTYGITQNQQIKLKPGSVAFCDLWPANGVDLFW